MVSLVKWNAFVTEWELAYHEVIDISKSYSNITRSILAERDAATLNKELRSKNMKEYYEAVKQVFDFLNERGKSLQSGWASQVVSFHFKASCIQREIRLHIIFFGEWEQKLLEIL